MRLGIITDIHDDVANLRAVLAELDRHAVEQIVVLGDVCDAFEEQPDALPIVRLLQEAGAACVWGNHDFGLCRNVNAKVRRKYDAKALEYFAKFQPRLELANCHFSHVDPWLDPEDVAQLWHFGGVPDSPESAAKSFAATRQRFIFLGHFHRWLLTSSKGAIPWDQRSAISLAEYERCLVVVAPVFAGKGGVFDTESCQLIPVSVQH